MKTEYSSFETVEGYKYLETILTNHKSMKEEIKSGLQAENACYHCVQNILSSSLLSKNVTLKINIIIMLLVVLYLCETWSLTVREKRRPSVNENSVLRGIFGPKRDGATREWRKLHNEELNDLFSSPNIVRVIKSRRMRWMRIVTRMGERRGLYRVLVGKPEGEKTLGRPRCRWEIILRWIFREWKVGV